MASKAYNEGFNSCLQSEYINPYPENSSEFDDYERGRSQKIKRSVSNAQLSQGFGGWGYDSSPECDSLAKPNAYARAKGK